MQPTTKSAYALLHRGSLALADIEYSGIKIDVKYLDQAIKDTEQKSADLENELKSDKIFVKWQKMHGQRTKLKSRPQLAKLLRSMGHDIPVSERTDKETADEEVLIKIDLPFVRNYEVWYRLELARSTFLSGIKKEVVDGYVHPSFNLNTTETHRSSCGNPNIQNQIRRNKLIAEIVRRSYISRSKDHVLLEVDCASHEFRVASAVWNDPTMIDYAANPDKDIHRDLAMKIFLCKKEDIKACKGLRDCAKNQVTFPTLYGSWWLKMSNHVWDFIDRFSLTVRNMPAKEWLAKKGITKLGPQDPQQRPTTGTFEKVLQKTETWFNDSFTVFSNGKKQRWEEYQKRGWFDFVTGFRIHGLHSKNFLLNSIIQGPAFHIVLWDLITLNKWLKKHKFKSRIVAEIHDSLLLDVLKTELPDLLPIIRKIMTVEVRKHWEWITVPLDIEAKVGENWFAMKEASI